MQPLVTKIYTYILKYIWIDLLLNHCILHQNSIKTSLTILFLNFRKEKKKKKHSCTPNKYIGPIRNLKFKLELYCRLPY